MRIMETVYGFAGHSIVPALALIHSKIADRYVLMFTEELEDNRQMFERYLEQKQWDSKEPEILLLSIGSVGDFAENYQRIKQIVDEEQEYGLFLQNGAKQLIMALLLQRPNAARVFLQEPLTLQIYDHLELRSETIVALSPEEVIDARGVKFEDSLLEDTTLEFDRRGRVQFTKTVDTLTEFAVGTFVQLISKFGRNGGVYRLVYNHATGRILNTIPPNVECIKEEEE
jgi:hypothetical protein